MPFLRAEGKHYIYDGLNGVPLRSVISKILAKISVTYSVQFKGQSR